MKLASVAFIIASVLLQACSSIPNAKLAIDNFPVSKVSFSSYRKGHQIGDEHFPPFRRIADFNITIIEGQWTAKEVTEYTKKGTYYGAQKHRWWSIEIHSEPTPQQRKDITSATDGYDTNLGWTLNASLRICPRFERKSFSWGDGVSFLAQYQNDNTNYVPNNGMLTYEVHGITNDGQYVRARFGVTHPGLVEFGPDVRDYRDGDPADPTSPMRKDSHYRLVEQSSSESFEPSLSAIDSFLNTLQTNKR